MKKSNIFIYLIILIIASITLNARENPFIPTKSYIEKKAEIIDESYQYETNEKDSVPEEIDSIKEEMEMVQEVNMEEPKRKETQNILHSGKHNFLSFVILEVSDDTLSITTHNQLLKKFDLNYKDTKKIVFDFKNSKGFYSKKSYLDSMNFKYISIGAHPKEGYYRIAISVEDIPSNYDVVYEENSIHIMKAQM